VNDFYLRGTAQFKFLKHVESKTSKFEIVVTSKSLARFITQFKEKESFNFLFAIKVKNTWCKITKHFGNKNSFKF